MTHARHDIRQAFAAAVTGLATTGDRVTVSSVLPMEQVGLPGLRVMIREDTAEPLDLDGTADLRTVAVTCEVYAAASGAVDHVLDEVSAQVEAAIAVDGSLGGVALWTRYEGCEIDFEAADAQVGVARMRFSVLCAR